jgi:NADH pyrophosphatase NudC (nudix superfamily)
MGDPRLGHTQDGELMHYSVGALIKKDNRYLLIDRVKPPYGYAGIAGHIDKGESAEDAIVREVREESGLEVKTLKLLKEQELEWNWCSKGVDAHYWYLFECEVEGEIVKNTKETKKIGWFYTSELKTLKLEEVWEYWFKELNIVK